MKANLEAMNIRTAMDLATADARALRDRFSVVIEKTARELAGTHIWNWARPLCPSRRSAATGCSASA